MKRRIFIPILACGVFVGACAPAPSQPTPDVRVIQTSAAQTVVANFTLTAAAFTPTGAPVTDTPLPVATDGSTATPTLLPGGVTATPVLCDALIYDAATIDVNVPDNTEMQLGQEFVKTWLVKNNGSCTWGAGYKVIYSSGERLSGVAQPFNAVVAPGQEVELSVNFKAPTAAGVYVSSWQMANATGVPFPRTFYVKIVVK
jgi:Ig-like domain-containing protein